MGEMGLSGFGGSCKISDFRLPLGSAKMYCGRRPPTPIRDFILDKNRVRASSYSSRTTGRILRYLAGSLGQGMAGKIVELRAVLLFSGAVCLVHSGTERKALIRATPSRERGNPLKIAFLAQNRFHLFNFKMTPRTQILVSRAT